MLHHRRVGRAQVNAHARARRPPLARAAGAAAFGRWLGDRRADRRRRRREPPTAGEPLLLSLG